MRALAVLAALILAPSASADVIVVAQAGTGDFVQVSAAVFAAEEGDTIWVRTGTYSRVEINGKSLHITAEDGARVNIASMSITDLEQGQVVTLAGLTLWNRQALPEELGVLTVRDCKGSVRVQDCRISWIEPPQSWLGFPVAWGVDYPALSVVVDNGMDVAFTACKISDGQASTSAASLLLQGSTVAMYDCDVDGADGGGDAVVMERSTLVVTGGTIDGGEGPYFNAWEPAGVGGAGLVASGRSRLYDIGATIAGGPGGTCMSFACDDVGPPGADAVLGRGVLRESAGSLAREWQCANLSFDDRMLSMTMQSQPGDRLYMVRSTIGGFELSAEHTSVRLVSQPEVASPYLGLHDSTWSSAFEFPIADLQIPGHGGSFLLQPYVVNRAGEVIWLAPRVLSILDAARLDPYLAPVHVDVSAAAGGDGMSWQTAFNDLGEALDVVHASYWGDLAIPREVWIAKGTYVAPLDDLDGFSIYSSCSLFGGFAGGESSLAGRDPSANPTVIDGDQLGDDGPSFVNYGDNASQLLLVNPVAHSSQVPASALVDGLIFRGTRPESDLDAVRVFRDTTVRNCTFRDNNPGGSSLRYSGYSDNELNVEDCLFQDNLSSSFGAALRVTDNFSVSDCRFVNNRAPADSGGAIVAYAKYWAGSSTIDHCFFRGNEATRGGAISITVDPGASPIISSCTLVDNRGVDGAGGIWVEESLQSPYTADPLDLRNSVLWGNSRAGVFDERAQIEFDDFGGVPRPLHYCNVQGWTGGYGGPGNHGLDPLLTATGELGSGSPCIDAGDNGAVLPDGRDLDSDGDLSEPRPFDLDGQPRFVDDPGVIDTGVGSAPIVDMGALER